MAEKKRGVGEDMGLSDSLENKKDEAPDSVDLGFSSEEQEKENVDDSINSSVENSSKNVVSCMGSQNPNIISESDEEAMDPQFANLNRGDAQGTRIEEKDEHCKDITEMDQSPTCAQSKTESHVDNSINNSVKKEEYFLREESAQGTKVEQEIKTKETNVLIIKLEEGRRMFSMKMGHQIVKEGKSVQGSASAGKRRMIYLHPITPTPSDEEKKKSESAENEEKMKSESAENEEKKKSFLKWLNDPGEFATLSESQTGDWGLARKLKERAFKIGSELTFEFLHFASLVGYEFVLSEFRPQGCVMKKVLSALEQGKGTDSSKEPSSPGDTEKVREIVGLFGKSVEHLEHGLCYPLLVETLPLEDQMSDMVNSMDESCRWLTIVQRKLCDLDQLMKASSKTVVDKEFVFALWSNVEEEDEITETESSILASLGKYLWKKGISAVSMGGSAVKKTGSYIRKLEKTHPKKTKCAKHFITTAAGFPWTLAYEFPKAVDTYEEVQQMSNMELKEWGISKLTNITCMSTISIGAMKVFKGAFPSGFDLAQLVFEEATTKEPKQAEEENAEDFSGYWVIMVDKEDEWSLIELYQEMEKAGLMKNVEEDDDWILVDEENGQSEFFED